MAFRVKIDNVEYDLKDNIVIKDELNETLDSATIQFNTYGQEANFESFDVAQIYDSNNKISKKYFLVDSFDDEIHSFGSSFQTDDHLYTVSLFSETKELERITLPNCSVTQPISGTKKSVYDEIERFCSLYVPRIKVYDSSETLRYSYQRKFAIDPALQTRFANIECPEFQWNNPTLREVLNDLVSTDDCIIVVRQGIISFYDLRQRGNPIDVSKLSFSKKTMSSQDYVGELTIDMQNAVGKSSSMICDGVTLRAPEGSGSLTTSNGVIKTLQPIYSIKRLRVKCPFKQNVNTDDGVVEVHSYAWIDITDRVLEKEEFDLLSNVRIQDLNSSAYQALPDFTDQNGVTEKKHKVNFLYFNRGGTDIYNVGTPYVYKPVGGVQRNIDFGEYALGEISYHLYGTGRPGQNTFGLNGNYDPRNFEFYLEYETVAEHSLKVGRNLPIKHPDNRMFDNQSNSYVDQEHMSIFEYAKINRLGHKLRVISGDYYSESDIPQLGDYIGDEILFSREITYQDNIFKFKGMLTPHYVLRDFFTGVRAKKRSWQIAKNEDALTRHDVYKLYIETSFNRKRETNLYPDADGITWLLNSLTRTLVADFIPIGIASYKSSSPTYAPSITLGCGVITKKGDTSYPDSSNVVVMDTESAILGKSICINFGFNDNYKSADYIVSDGSELTQSFYAYADGNGEFNTEELIIYWANIRTGTNQQKTTSTYDLLVSDIRRGYEKPKVSKDALLSTIQTAGVPGTNGRELLINVQKDNREIIQHTLQFEFCSDTEDIIVTKNFLNRIMFFSKTKYNADDYKIYLSPVKYSRDANTVLGTYDASLTISRTDVGGLSGILLTVYSGGMSAAIPSGIKSWAVTDLSGNLLLAVNIPDGATAMECYFNLLRSRDDRIYSDTYNGIPVGDITNAGIAAAPTNYAALTTRASTNINVQGRSILRSSTISENPNAEEEQEE